METIQIILGAIIIVLAVVLMVVIMSQQGKNDGLGAMAGGSSDTDSFFGKNKSRSKDAILAKITIALSILLAVLVVVLVIVS